MTRKANTAALLIMLLSLETIQSHPAPLNPARINDLADTGIGFRMKASAIAKTSPQSTKVGEVSGSPRDSGGNRAGKLVSDASNQILAAPPVGYFNSLKLDGSYDFGYSTADGQMFYESGNENASGGEIPDDEERENTGNKVVQGGYAYISPEGYPVSVQYIADKNGFRIVNLPDNS